MPLHIIGIAACGGLLLTLPRLRHTIHHLRVVYHVTHLRARHRREREAAAVFAYEVNELLERHQRETGQRLITYTDQWGGTHCDLAAINPRTHQPRMRPAVAFLHGYPVSEQTTEPNAPAIAYRAYRGISGTVRSGSFGRPVRARTTRILPAWTGDDTGGDDDAA